VFLDGFVHHVERVCLGVRVRVLLLHVLARAQLVALAVQHVLNIQLAICGLDNLENVSAISGYTESIQKRLWELGAVQHHRRLALFQRAVGAALFVVTPLPVGLQLRHVLLAGHNHVHIQKGLAERIGVVPLLVSLGRLEGICNVRCAEFGHFFPAMSVEHAEQRHLSFLRVVDIQVDDM